MCEEYPCAPASLADSSDSASSHSLEGIRVCITMDKVTGSRIATPSLATSSVSSLSNILSLIQDEQRGHNGQVWMDVDNMNLKCTSEYDEAQSEIQNVGKCGATCVTLQLLDVKTKCPPAVHQKVVGSARFRSAERKGVELTMMHII